VLLCVLADQQRQFNIGQTLTERVQHWQELTPDRLVLPHPSPRNQLWLKKNAWFEDEVVPWLQKRVEAVRVAAATAN
ncbi:MAG: hypothetical protein AAFN68_08275, partial [Pseudomonadota bacterium]